MPARRVTPSFVAGFVGGAVLAVLVLWGGYTVWITGRQERLALAFGHSVNRCTQGLDDLQRAMTSLSFIEHLDAGDPDSARAAALSSARISSIGLRFHAAEFGSRDIDQLEHRLARAQAGTPIESAQQAVDDAMRTVLAEEWGIPVSDVQVHR